MRYRSLIRTFLAICLGVLAFCIGGTATAGNQLTYDDIKNTGLANLCPEISSVTGGSISVGSGFTLTDLCMEPTDYFVKVEPTNARQKARFVPAKVLTRYTTTLTQVSGELKAADGGITFIEEDGIDFQPITVQKPDGERVPFLFTVKGLIAKANTKGIGNSTTLSGGFRVPSYRTSMFLDPKGRGLASGYDNAVGLIASADDEDILRENIKTFEIGSGKVSLSVSKVNTETGEVAGTFETIQSSDTDLGAKAPEEVKVQGVFYAIVEPA
ncbi:MAG: Photosystem II manganese-stabilizing polypeptide [Cyanothece sp. SIO1E1]|nr:Photosystem II manganese-stabilizing polypeptide [Cyanothece sp. SIO1E1]